MGAWSFEGVTTTIVDSSHVQCHSTHMTSFAILVDLSGITVVCKRPVKVLVSGDVFLTHINLCTGHVPLFFSHHK